MTPEISRGTARWKSETIGEFLASTESSQVPFIVDRLVPAGDLTFLIGAPKQGKTMLAEAMAVAVASGQAFADHFEVRQGPVLLILEEDRREEVRGRLEGFARGMGLDLPILPIFLLVRKGWRLDQPEGIKWLLEELGGKKIVLVVVDCLSGVHQLRENERDDMGRLLRPLSSLLDPLGAALLFTHHTRKHGEGEQAGVYSARGSGELSAIARSLLYLTRKGSLWRVNPIGNYEPPPPFSLLMENEDGTRTVSVVGDEKARGTSLEGDSLALIEKEPRLSTAEIRARLRRRAASVQECLERLEKAGRIAYEPTRQEGVPVGSRAAGGWVIRHVH